MNLNNLNLVQLSLLLASVNDYLPKLNNETLDFKDLSELRQDIFTTYQAKYQAKNLESSTETLFHRL